MIYILMYMDDIVIIGFDQCQDVLVIKAISEEFVVKELDNKNYFLEGTSA